MTAPPTDARLGRVRTLARVLDSAVGVPGTRMRVGLDPILGLIPGVGDFAGAALSSYIVLTGIQLGASRPVVIRMIANVTIDALVGAVPLLGDLFDAGWKSNGRNVALLERHLAIPDSTRTSSRGTLIVAALVLLLIIAGAAALTFYGVQALIHLASR